MHTFILFALANLAAAGPLVHRAAVNVPVIKGNTEPCNITTTYPWKLRRDGGGGGTIDGKHVLNFADTRTLNEPFYKAHGFYPFISNSIATASDDGMTVHDYGTDWVKQMWPYATRKNPIKGNTKEESKPNHRYAIWPNTNIVTGCNGKCGYTISDVVDITFRKLPYTEKFIYSTLSKITLGPAGPVVSREVVSLWYAYQINYGSFGLARARDGTDDIFMFAAPKGSFGVKVARVCESDIANKSKYKYWNGKTWAKKPPAAWNSKANIFNYNEGGWGPGTGEVFWNAHLGTWIAVFNDLLSANSIFRLMYSTTGDITGPWSTKPIDLYKAPSCDDNDNYAGKSHCSVTYNYGTHAYPNIDPTGKTLLLGWTYNGAQTMFATVEFA